MKLSSFYKASGDDVVLKTNYGNLEIYDKIIISKVFIKTEIPFEPKDKSLKIEENVIEYYKNNKLLNMDKVEFGGTGFFYDKAPDLPYQIEHAKPDYHLYDQWVETQIKTLIKKTEEKQKKPLTKVQIDKIKKEFIYYTDYSIGYTTRGCVNKCDFCVNKKYDKCSLHSPVSEFINNKRPYICLLDDNVFSCVSWKKVFTDLQKTNKPFQFKQGLDERLLTDEKCKTLFDSNWIGDYIFAFDNIENKEIIESKLQLLREYTNRVPKFYVFCAYNHNNNQAYNNEFWNQDIFDLFERIKILMNYNCLPYIMRHENYKKSPNKKLYSDIARWCNQPQFFKKMSFEQFCKAHGENSTNYKNMIDFKINHPDVKEYFEMKYETQ